MTRKTIQREPGMLPDRKLATMSDLQDYLLDLRPQSENELHDFLLVLEGNEPVLAHTDLDSLARSYWKRWNWQPASGEMVEHEGTQYPIVRRTRDVLTLLGQGKTFEANIDDCEPV